MFCSVYFDVTNCMAIPHVAKEDEGFHIRTVGENVLYKQLRKADLNCSSCLEDFLGLTAPDCKKKLRYFAKCLGH